MKRAGNIYYELAIIAVAYFGFLVLFGLSVDYFSRH